MPTGWSGGSTTSPSPIGIIFSCVDRSESSCARCCRIFASIPICSGGNGGPTVPQPNRTMMVTPMDIPGRKPRKLRILVGSDMIKVLPLGIMWPQLFFPSPKLPFHLFPGGTSDLSLPINRSFQGQALQRVLLEMWRDVLKILQSDGH